MAPQDALFGNLTQTQEIRRLGVICFDRMDDATLDRLLAQPDPAPFGTLRQVRAVVRH